MPINGVETIIYGVEDVENATRFLVDFGLRVVEQSSEESRFELAEGSSVIVRPLDRAKVAGTSLTGYGVHETIWGVTDGKSLEMLVAGLAVDREVRRDADGTAHFLADDGLAIGLRVFNKRHVNGAPDPVNSLHSINRINSHRKWYTRARPKTIQHVVFNTPDPDLSWAFYRDRLGFRLSDVQVNFGIFGRGDACTDHHNIYFLNAKLPFPRLTGEMQFNHVNYGVESIDEVMVGANYMERKGWPRSLVGLGRHRIASSVFLYLPSPLGGDAEYGADSDALDESWTPRTWNASFGYFSWAANLGPHMMDEAPWEVQYTEGEAPGARGATRAIPAGPEAEAGTVPVHPHLDEPPAQAAE